LEEANKVHPDGAMVDDVTAEAPKVDEGKKEDL